MCAVTTETVCSLWKVDAQILKIVSLSLVYTSEKKIADCIAFYYAVVLSQVVNFA